VKFQVLIFVFFLIGCKQSESPINVERAQPSACAECPKMTDSQDTIAYINRLRRFVAKNADSGLIRNQFCDTFYKIPIEEFDVSRYLRIFENDEGTASCGLAAQIMVKILLENGMDAYTYNFGFKGHRLSHVIVLVKVNARLLIFDPYFNYQLIDSVGANVDLFSLINAVGGNRAAENIFFDSDTVISDLLVDFSVVEPWQLINAPIKCVEKMDDRIWLRDSIFKIDDLRCYECDISNPCGSFVKDFEEKLKNDTRFTTFYQAITLKINEVYGAADCHRLNALVDSAITRMENFQQHTP